MILWFMLSVFAASPDAQWQTADTGVYRPIVAREVAVGPKGRVFLVCREEVMVKIYGTSGSLEKSFSSKGKGPGEMIVPTWVHLWQNQLFIEDAGSNHIHVFDLQGNFVSRIKIPVPDLILKKTAHGWLIGDWELPAEGERPSRLMSANEELKGLEIVTHWKREVNSPVVSTQITGSKKTMIPFNPAPTKGFLSVSDDGKVAYLIQPGDSKVYAFDTGTRKEVANWVIPGRPIPFNKDWGNAQLQVAKDYLIPTEAKAHLALAAQYPEDFPLVRDFRVIGSDVLAITLWTGTPDTKFNVLFLNKAGKKIGLKLDPPAAERLLAIRGDRAYVSVYNEDLGEGRINRIPKAGLNQFLKDHPVDFEGISGNIISVINN